MFTNLNVKTVLFQVIQFNISTQFSSIWNIDRTLSVATILGLSGPESNDNERVIHIPQSSSITGALSSDCLVSYPGHSLGESFPLQRCHWYILQLQSTWLEHLCEVKCRQYCPGFYLVWFHGISIIVAYLMPNPLNTYILNMYDL